MKSAISRQRRVSFRHAVPIGRTLKHVAGKALRRYGFVEADIILRWRDIAGAELSALSAPERITRRRGRDGAWETVLTVRAEGAAALEVQHMSGELLQRLEAFCGKRAPKRIRVVQSAPRLPKE